MICDRHAPSRLRARMLDGVLREGIVNCHLFYPGGIVTIDWHTSIGGPPIPGVDMVTTIP